MIKLPFAIAIIVTFYVIFILWLLIMGKQSAARAVAGFIPDCVVLFKNLVKDANVPRRYKVVIGGLIAYLALPIDVVPDFIPVAGQLDDAILVVIVLRSLLKRVGVATIHKNWRGPESSLKILLKFARIN